MEKQILFVIRCRKPSADNSVSRSSRKFDFGVRVIALGVFVQTIASEPAVNDTAITSKIKESFVIRRTEQNAERSRRSRRKQNLMSPTNAHGNQRVP